MATIYYLQRDSEDPNIGIRAEALRERFRDDPLTEIPEDDFSELYTQHAEFSLEALERQAAAVETSSLDEGDEESGNSRDLGIGDIVKINEQYFAWTPSGWIPIELI